MIRSLSQTTAQQQASERQRDKQRQSRQLFLQNRDARRNDPRATPQPAQAQDAPSAGKRLQPEETRRPAAEDRSLFSSLLEADDVMAPRLMLDQGSDQQQGFAQLEESSLSGAPPAMALWQEIEPALAGALAEQPPGEMMLTLMLPKLGNVQAQMASLPGGGWDIALHLQPGAWQALLPHQERCRFSLRQKMACRVKLRFERRADEDRESAG